MAAPLRYRDDQFFVIGGLEQLVVRENVQRRLVVGELAFREIRILLGQHRADIGEAQAEAVQQSRIDIHAHRRQRAAADVD